MAHIAMLLPTLGGGGAERVALTLAEQFRARGDRVSFVLASARGELLAEVPPGSDVVDLGAGRYREIVAPLADYLRRAAPFALQASMWPMTSYAVQARARADVSVRLMLTDHVNLIEDRAGDAWWRRLAMRGLMTATYRRADVCTAVSAGAARTVERLALLPRGTVVSIPNPIPAIPAVAPVAWPLPGARILCVGALKPQKNHALLLRAFARLAAERPASLAIVGDGPLRAALGAQAQTLGIADRVHFAGFVADPAPWYRAADVLALASDYEGFGNVLAEALGVGLPVVATDCRDGPADILGDGRWGKLVPVGDAAALAEALATQLDTPPDRGALIERAQAFAPPAIADRYRALLLGTSQ